MIFLTNLVGVTLMLLGVDGYYNNGYFTSLFMVTNHDVAMTMLITGSLVTACGLCLCEFRSKTRTKPSLLRFRKKRVPPQDTKSELPQTRQAA